MIICGTDEAGRGPVIGPMVIAAATIDEKDEFKLKALGVKDSKLLSVVKRDELFELIKETVLSYTIKVVTPQKIDEAVLSPKSNLNWLEAEVTAELIGRMRCDKAYLDCPSNNVAAYTARVLSLLKERSVEIELISEHKADTKYPVVAAASILAKVTRDREIAKIRKEIGVEFGSGYPADPKTAAFVRESYDKYPVFRKSWSSWQRAAEEKKQKHLGDF